MVFKRTLTRVDYDLNAALRLVGHPDLHTIILKMSCKKGIIVSKALAVLVPRSTPPRYPAKPWHEEKVALGSDDWIS